MMMMFSSARLKTSIPDVPLVTACCATSGAQKINIQQRRDFYPTSTLTTSRTKEDKVVWLRTRVYEEYSQGYFKL
jgi:hypothetical protein